VGGHLIAGDGQMERGFTTGWDHAGDSVASGEGGLGLGSFLRAGTRAVSAFSSQALGGDAVHMATQYTRWVGCALGLSGGVSSFALRPHR
jgi:hypothetical protein